MYDTLFSPQNIITIVAVIGSFLSVLVSWNKLGEERRSRLANEAETAKNEAIWQTKIESKLETMNSKIDLFTGLEKSNAESIRLLRDSMMTMSYDINSLKTELTTAWKRIDEANQGVTDLMRNQARD